MTVITLEECCRARHLHERGYPVNIIADDLINARCSAMRTEIKEEVRRLLTDILM